MKMSWATKFALLFAGVLFVACMTQDAVVFDRTCPGSIDRPASSAPVAGLNNAPLGETSISESFVLLLFGWFGSGGLGGVGWWANPCAALALVNLLRGQVLKARHFSVGAFALAATSLYATNFFYLIGDEGGVCRLSAVSALSGYWLWLASIAALVFASFTACLPEPRRGDSVAQ